MESITRNQDCMEVMQEFPDKFFDLAVVDPPYGLNITGFSHTHKSSAAEADPSAGKSIVWHPSKNDLTKRTFIPCSMTAPHRARIISGSLQGLANGGLFGEETFFLSIWALQAALSFGIKNAGAWIKPTAK